MKQQTAILVAVGTSREDELINEHLDELAFLAETAGIQTIKRMVQHLPSPDPRTFIGKGKLTELKEYVRARQVTRVIFDDDLSPSQLRNLERELNPKGEEASVKVYDRSLLILDIFLYRAQTAQARTQVELAMNQYLLPRLTRMWTHLERQRGGTGTRGGAGEREIETDRRNIRNSIKVLEDRLEKIEKQKATQRKSRGNVVRVALVGYTNVGKSTLMNLLSGSGVLAENKLFATVDSTVRKVVLGGIPFLLSDTVGFIRKLPHHLIESFKSTLDEVREADILIHVVDAAHRFHDNQIQVVSNTLTELGAGSIPTILVLNKIDQLKASQTEEEPVNLEAMSAYYRQQGYEHVVMVSAVTGENIDQLKAVMLEQIKKRHLQIYPNYLKSGYDYMQDYSVSTGEEE
ncbi:MAG TPA: GTPase HflX [Cyclobacteriaceae bacterium]|nr:GTPase HflX [Cyclobacteriaceae bacterium]HMV09773.1 GTPase HflX [Cyclobacteriaceae bacterium]HMV88780.1 GTPase HflX [Cyclobacteriaceae bacterium]HMX02326.1 GTPase HflX [Cyclobacteriaceae bacterium]HMX52218.1 GTPase HflX [Cyclobacteriaceae bacterium]